SSSATAPMSSRKDNYNGTVAWPISPRTSRCNADYCRCDLNGGGGQRPVRSRMTGSRWGGTGRLGGGPGVPAASSVGPAVAAAPALQAERIERRMRTLRDQHGECRHLPRRRHEVIREIHRQRFAPLVVEEFLEQRAADALREPARELPFDQHRIDRPADVI